MLPLDNFRGTSLGSYIGFFRLDGVPGTILWKSLLPPANHWSSGTLKGARVQHCGLIVYAYSSIVTKFSKFLKVFSIPLIHNSEEGFLCTESTTTGLMRVPGDDSPPSHRCRVGGCRRGRMAISLSLSPSISLSLSLFSRRVIIRWRVSISSYLPPAGAPHPGVDLQSSGCVCVYMSLFRVFHGVWRLCL